MFQLHKVSPIVKKRKRVGRGGKLGGTAGKGHKGQKARSGHSKLRRGFEGGQIPLVRRLPKRGFNNAVFKKEYVVINIGFLEKFFDQGTTITKQQLLEKNLIKHLHDAVKILGKGTLSKKFEVHGDAFSKQAQEAITRCGGVAHIIKES